MKTGKEKILIIAALAYFFVCVLSLVNTLELFNDEAMPGSAALRLASLYPDVVIPHEDSFIMFSPYEGRPVIFIQGLLLYLFGPSVFFLRLPFVIMSGVALVLIYYVCRSWFNKKVAFLTFFLTATNTGFIKASAQGDFRDEIFQIFAFWLALAAIQLYLSKRKQIYLYLCGFIAGIGLWAKLMFLGYILGIVVSCLVFGKKAISLLREKIFLKQRDIIIFLAAFLIGCGPLLYYNIITANATLSSIIGVFGGNASSGWDNHNFFPNLYTRLISFNCILGEFIGGAPTKFLPFVFYLSFFLVILQLLLHRKEAVSRDKVLFFVLLYVVFFMLSCFTPGGYPLPEHLLVLFPFPQLIIAVCLALIYGLSSKKILRGLVICVFILLCIEQQIVTRRLCVYASGANKLKTQIEITDYLLKHRIDRVFTFNTGILRVADFLSQGKVMTYGYNGGYDLYYWDLPSRSNSHQLPWTLDVVYEKKLEPLSQFYLVSDDSKFSLNMRYRLEALLKKDRKSLFMMQEFKNGYSSTEFKLYSAH